MIISPDQSDWIGCSSIRVMLDSKRIYNQFIEGHVVNRVHNQLFADRQYCLCYIAYHNGYNWLNKVFMVPV